MNVKQLAKKLAEENKLIRAESYDLVPREFDKMVELIGLVPDPNYDIRDFAGREMVFPKRWVTLAVFPDDMKVTV